MTFSVDFLSDVIATNQHIVIVVHKLSTPMQLECSTCSARDISFYEDKLRLVMYQIDFMNLTSVHLLIVDGDKNDLHICS